MLIKNQIYSEGTITKKKYKNGLLAVFLNDRKGESVAELSINDDSIELDFNEFVLKNYSENSEIAQSLLDSKLIIPTDRFVLIGSHLCPICKVAI